MEDEEKDEEQGRKAGVEKKRRCGGRAGEKKMRCGR